MKHLLLLISFIFITLLTVSASAPIDFDITKQGAVGDGKTLNTDAIQKTIDLCSQQGGGKVIFPDGTWLSGTLMLKNNVTLFLSEKAILLGSTNIADYQIVDGFKDGRGSNMGYCFIGAKDVKNSAIEGKGKIDGNGKLLLEKNGKAKRPFLIRFVRCTNLTVKDVNMQGPAAWTMHFFECTKATAENVSIKSRGLSNNDGIDIDCCDGVNIKNCNIDSGDDAICIKATGPKPCKNIEVSGCRLNTNQGAFKIGTESFGDFENINIHDCKVDSTKGIKLYSVDGAHLKHLTISNIEIEKTTVAVMIRLGARLKTFREGDVKKPTGTLEDVILTNINVKQASQIAILISGIPGNNIKNITLSNINVHLKGGGKAEDASTLLAENESDYPEVTMFGKVMPAYGIYLRHANEMKFDHINLTTQNPDGRPAIIGSDLTNITLTDFKLPAHPAGQTIMNIESGNAIKLTNLNLPKENEILLQVMGGDNSKITVPLKQEQINSAIDIPRNAHLIIK